MVALKDKYYLELECENPKKLYSYNDVKKACVEFDTWLFEHRHDSVDYFTIQDIRNKHCKIFGDFTEYKDVKKLINKAIKKENKEENEK